jgi:hypothetical protein
MITNWPANLHDLGNVIYDLFLLPGTFVLSQFGAHAPDLALKLGIGVEGNGLMLPAIVSLLVWSLLGILVWKTVIAVYSRIFYGTRRLKTFLVCKLQTLNRRRLLSLPVSIPEVEFDELDIAVLNTGSTLPPGLALTATELSGQLTKRPAQVQRSLDKLRKYGLVDDTSGTPDGFDNFRLTRSGAYLLSMWQRKGNGGQLLKTTPFIK